MINTCILQNRIATETSMKQLFERCDKQKITEKKLQFITLDGSVNMMNG